MSLVSSNDTLSMEKPKSLSSLATSLVKFSGTVSFVSSNRFRIISLARPSLRRFLSAKDKAFSSEETRPTKPEISRASFYLELLTKTLEERRQHVPLRYSKIPLDMPFVDYLNLWLKTKTKIQAITYSGYQTAINGKIAKFFGQIGSTLGNLKPEDFEDYYDYLLIECGWMIALRFIIIAS